MLAAAISSLFMAPKIAKVFASNAYAAAELRYNPEGVIRQLLEAYGRIKDGV